MLKGLSSQQAAVLLTEHGLNTIEEKKRRSLLTAVVEQFNNFLTVLLVLAALISFFIGETTDGALIVTIIVLNALFGLYQERKAEEAIEALSNMSVSSVRVLRDGKEIALDSRYLVPGDVVYVEEGVKIPADADVHESVNLELNEAALTGESLPVVKKSSDSVFMGTIVVKGRGRIVVQKTGMHTKFGEIAQHLDDIVETKTPLQLKLNSLSRLLGVAGILISLAVFILSYMQGGNAFASFLLSISLAVAVVPEGLPAVLTITMAIGVKEMAKKKAIVRKLAAIEALGNITLIATDKTGTITANKMKVKELYVDGKTFEASEANTKHASLHQLMLNGILCSTASLVKVHDGAGYNVLGDPTEGALLILAEEKGMTPEQIKAEWKLTDEHPFDSVTKRMSVEVKQGTQTVVYTKGAPESVLELTTKLMVNGKEVRMTEEKRKQIRVAADKWAKKGLRILAFSMGGKNVHEGNVFIGMVAIHDPPREEVSAAIQRAFAAGIKVVMITGDNEVTAEAIGVATGLMKKGDMIVTGKQLEDYSDEELMQILPKVKVFARTTPFHKSRIVGLYQKLGEVVAVTGDGINDAIALKQADVGISMGLVGTDVARETSDMVITDDNFASIVNAIDEGRNIIKNLQSAIKYLLSCNIAEALSLMIGLVLGIPHLFYPIQLLYTNLVTDGIPALALGFSPRDDRNMMRPPERNPKLLKLFDVRYIIAVGISASMVIIASYYLFLNQGEVYGRTAAFTVLALVQSFIFVDVWISHRSVHKALSYMRRPIFFIGFMVPFILQFILLETTGFASVFNVHTVSYAEYGILIVVASCILVVIHGIKYVIGEK